MVVLIFLSCSLLSLLRTRISAMESSTLNMPLHRLSHEWNVTPVSGSPRSLQMLVALVSADRDFSVVRWIMGL